ncbi:TonB-dependent receptor [Maridesulfovibrio ferrireducens]|uniref:TonB-dependent receptor n=1 Tax=Maridesulfovibrio ferrireducens TaxID=246191 RepID=UPI001A1866BD|nr:TonB-dependent receptor [Maridesulfovibrio ferrireducens]MBI9113310.1 hypothetical protein [Maridesulfovibrio ferrireducens]
MNFKTTTGLLVKSGIGLMIAAGLALLLMQALNRDNPSQKSDKSVEEFKRPDSSSIRMGIMPPSDDPSIQTGNEPASSLEGISGSESDIYPHSDFELAKESLKTDEREKADSVPKQKKPLKSASTKSRSSVVRKKAPVVLAPLVKPKPSPPPQRKAEKEVSSVVPVPVPVPVIAQETPVEKEQIMNSELDTPMYESKSLTGTDRPVADGDIILDVYLRSNLVYQGLFCQGRGGNLFVPIGEMFGILGFAIDVTPKGAEGWFIKDNRKFSFSLETGEAISNKQTYMLPMDKYFYSEDDIYMELKQFNSLFPLKIKPDFQNLILWITPYESLPMELMKMRQDERRIYQAKNGLRYPLRDLDYASVAPPRLDAKVSLSYQDKDKKQSTRATAAGLFRGDLLYMSTALYGAVTYDYTKDKSKIDFKDLSLTAERLFLDNPYIAKVTIGDIIPSTTPLGSTGKLERGVRISNKNSMSSTTSDAKTFAGKGIPGWDVELYRNNQLIGFQTIDISGNYLFEDVTLNYGVNRFKLVLYGTEGQQEIREEIVTVGSSLTLGDVEYDSSFSQQGVGVFSEKVSKVDPTDTALKGTTRLKSGVNIGIGNGLGLRTGLTMDTYRNKERTVGSVGLSGGYDVFLGQFDLGYSTYGSTDLKASVRGQLDGGQNINMGLKYQLSDNYEESSIKNNLQFGFSDNTNFTQSIRLAYSANLARTTEHTGYDDDSKYYDLSGSLNFFSDIGHFSSNLGGRLYENKVSDEEPNLYGSFTFYRAFKDGSLRANAEFGVDDSSDSYIRSLSSTGNLRVTPKLNTSVTVSKYLTGAELLSVGNTWSYSFGKISPYIQGTWYNDDSYFLYAGFSLSVDFDPSTYLPQLSSGSSGLGGAACLVYNDKNYNNVFDGEDKPLEDITLKAHQSNKHTITDENGRAFLYQLAPMRSTDVSVDEDLIKDIRLAPKGGVAITPREGKVYNLEFPLHVCGEIEGYAYLIVDDKIKGRAHIPMQLLDKDDKIIEYAWTEQDGFFALAKILPGNYKLRIDPKYLEKKSYSGTTVENIEINTSGNIVSDAFLFFGKEKIIGLLKDKFTTKLKLGDDAQNFFDYTDLDTPQETNIMSTESQISELLVQLKTEEFKGLDAEIASPVNTDSNIIANNVVSSTEENTSNNDIVKNYALVLDVFISEKSAIRAISHYEKVYPDKLKGYSLSYQKKGDGFSVILKGVNSKKKMLAMANLFMCTPQLIRIAELN